MHLRLTYESKIIIIPTHILSSVFEWHTYQLSLNKTSRTRHFDRTSPHLIQISIQCQTNHSQYIWQLSATLLSCYAGCAERTSFFLTHSIDGSVSFGDRNIKCLMFRPLFSKAQRLRWHHLYDDSSWTISQLKATPRTIVAYENIASCLLSWGTCEYVLIFCLWGTLWHTSEFDGWFLGWASWSVWATREWVEWWAFLLQFCPLGTRFVVEDSAQNNNTTASPIRTAIFVVDVVWMYLFIIYIAHVLRSELDRIQACVKCSDGIYFQTFVNTLMNIKINF